MLKAMTGINGRRAQVTRFANSHLPCAQTPVDLRVIAEEISSYTPEVSDSGNCAYFKNYHCFLPGKSSGATAARAQQ